MALLLLLSYTQPAHARWDRLKAYLQPQAEIIEESDEHIVLRSGSGEAAIEMVFTIRWTPESDVYGDIARRSGGNPYRIWVVSERLAADQSRPKPEWNRLLRTEFLRILRPPQERHGAR